MTIFFMAQYCFENKGIQIFGKKKGGKGDMHRFPPSFQISMLVLIATTTAIATTLAAT